MTHKHMTLLHAVLCLSQIVKLLPFCQPFFTRLLSRFSHPVAALINATDPYYGNGTACMYQLCPVCSHSPIPLQKSARLAALVLVLVLVLLLLLLLLLQVAGVAISPPRQQELSLAKSSSSPSPSSSSPSPSSGSKLSAARRVADRNALRTGGRRRAGTATAIILIDRVCV